VCHEGTERRSIDRLLEAMHPAPDYSLIWHAKDDDGREATASDYLARLSAPRGRSTRRVVVAR